MQSTGVPINYTPYQKALSILLSCGNTKAWETDFPSHSVILYSPSKRWYKEHFCLCFKAGCYNPGKFGFLKLCLTEIVFVSILQAAKKAVAPTTCSWSWYIRTWLPYESSLEEHTMTMRNPKQDVASARWFLTSMVLKQTNSSTRQSE